MKFKVIWHDCEDGVSGSAFEVEGKSPGEAYHEAEAQIKCMSAYIAEHYCPTDIEGLVNEKGEVLIPEMFLGGDKESGNGALWKKVFSAYKEVNFFSSPAFRSILKGPATFVLCGPSGGYADCEYFEDNEHLTYFYDFSTANLDSLGERRNPSDLERFLVLMERNFGEESKNRTVGNIVEELLEKKKKITHIVKSSEEYSECGRAFLKADVYEVTNGR